MCGVSGVEMVLMSNDLVVAMYMAVIKHLLTTYGVCEVGRALMLSDFMIKAKQKRMLGLRLHHAM